MEHWPGHERQETDKSKWKGNQKERRRESIYWQWPHLEYGSIGRGTLISKNGRVQWSSVTDTSRGVNLRWSSVGGPTKIFPETRLPQVDIHEHSASKRAEKGLQYLRTYFPDADFPGELLGNMLETDIKELRRLKSFDPFIGNMLEIIPSHHTQNEFIVVFPMGELGRELNISRLSSDVSGTMVFNPTGSPSFAFETPILQVSSAAPSSERITTPFSTLLIRTYASSSLLRLERSRVIREVDITRAEIGDIPVVDSRILASGPDIVTVNRSGKVYKCNTYHGGKAMQLIGGHRASNDDYFWQLGITGRHDECFLTSYKAVQHIDLRSTNRFSDVFCLDHPTAIVTSFESPVQDYISRITSTSEVIWLDSRFRKRPLLSFKHYRSFDRTLRAVTANCIGGASLTLLTSRTNGLVTLYDVSRSSDGLLHCNSVPSCLPNEGSVFTAYDGHALVALPSDTELTLLRLRQRGSIYRQDIRTIRPDEDRTKSVQERCVVHHWDDDVQELERQVNESYIDFGPAGGRHHIEVNLRGAYEEMFAYEDAQEGADRNAFKDMLARLPNIWEGIEKDGESMLTTFDVMSAVEDENSARRTMYTGFLAGISFDPKQVSEALMSGDLPIQKLADLVPWHYRVHSTSIPGLGYDPIDCRALHEHLKQLNLVSRSEDHDLSVQREASAKEELVADLVLSNDVYSTGPLAKPCFFAVEEARRSTTYPVQMVNGEEPPEITLGYFHPARKSGADHYADKDRDDEQDFSSPLGVRLLLAEWELGVDPQDYAYRDPYGLGDTEAQTVLQYRRLPAETPMTQREEMPPQRPPLVVAAAARLPMNHTMGCAPPLAHSQTIQEVRSQQFGRGFDVSSQEPMMSTQVVPGRFGGRPTVEKKSTKKRIGGF